MKHFHVNFFEDLSSFIALCKLISQQNPTTPVFYCESTSVHCFIATDTYRAHFQSNTMNAEHVADKVRAEGCLHTIRASVSHWVVESPVFVAPFDTSPL